ncbi:MAG: hypothetical protein SGPRY_013050, partial [Prymnesium sp.]
IVRRLPRSWHLCYVGYHESSEQLLAADETPRLREVREALPLTGLFGYLVSREGATQLLRDHEILPLRRQIDVALARRQWPRGSRQSGV